MYVDMCREYGEGAGAGGRGQFSVQQAVSTASRWHDWLYGIGTVTSATHHARKNETKPVGMWGCTKAPWCMCAGVCGRVCVRVRVCVCGVGGWGGGGGGRAGELRGIPVREPLRASVIVKKRIDEQAIWHTELCARACYSI
jgi:hypothetical protein